MAGGFTEVECDNCHKIFSCQNFRIEQHKHLFCSKKCNAEYVKKQTPLNCVCDYCGKAFHIKPSHIHPNWNCCSMECSKKLRKIKMAGELNHQYALKGSLNASWKSNERISTYGYRLIRCLNHPFRNGNDFVFEHRLVAEKYLLTEENSIEIDGKKYLSPDFIVHHVDFNRLNNDVSNLRIMPLGIHTKFHQYYKKMINSKLSKSDSEYDDLLNIMERYDIPNFQTVDDETDGVRNGGFGSTSYNV